MMKLTAMQGPARNALRQHNLAHRYASVAPAKSLIWRANDADRRSPEEQAYASTASYTTRNASTQSRNTTSPYILPPVLAPPSESSPQPLVPKPAKGLLQKLFTRYSFKGTQDRIHRAEALYQAVTRQATDPRWFGRGRIGRDFRPRHALITMHLWFLHKRLISDGLDKDTALLVQEELFNILWDDTTCRIRQQGVKELIVNKHLLQVQQFTFIHLTHYDHAFTEFLDKPAERMEELRKIIWQHVLVRDPELENQTDYLDRIAWYVEANYQNIMMDWPDEHYREARVAWVDLPDFSGLTDAAGKLLDANPENPEDVLPKPWLRNITNRGVEYYWNPETMKSRWDRPTK